ncbi:hypothetical protein ACP8HI_25515 [Paenibacillus sp. FA6]|uniref:hypothetical protein n=1 Tax=Paenibacillus sp. FA6 TaxID=3413029 RepID=UPI003F65862F
MYFMQLVVIRGQLVVGVGGSSADCGRRWVMYRLIVVVLPNVGDNNREMNGKGRRLM